jgi:hypothetical protein
LSCGFTHTTEAPKVSSALEAASLVSSSWSLAICNWLVGLRGKKVEGKKKKEMCEWAGDIVSVQQNYMN